MRLQLAPVLESTGCMEECKPWYHEYCPEPGKAPFDFQLGQQRRWPSPIFDDGSSVNAIQ